jgi:hypothetical protein
VTIHSSVARSRGQPEDASEYELGFVAQVHLLLVWGYERLRASNFQAPGEEDISGELARSMVAVIEDGLPPDWKCDFSVHNEKPIDGSALGKNRLIIDLELEQAGRGLHPRFQFETKRLRKTKARRDSVALYFGDEGVKCFVDGGYGRGQPAAGMVGFMQTHDEPYWLTKLQARLRKIGTDIGWNAAAGWMQVELVVGRVSAHRTVHKRAKEHGGQLEVFHTLLSFCAPASKSQ